MALYELATEYLLKEIFNLANACLETMAETAEVFHVANKVAKNECEVTRPNLLLTLTPGDRMNGKNKTSKQIHNDVELPLPVEAIL